ncbi:hypothetical protein TWF569_005292 [Orbilia oligospora]|nr:hypothetical protein TWF594_008453 [Orbilia oligospora]KAF3148794.1 hypothetical protein TWF569_005292 [Orbilia oligospora]
MEFFRKPSTYIHTYLLASRTFVTILFLVYIIHTYLLFLNLSIDIGRPVNNSKIMTVTSIPHLPDFKLLPYKLPQTTTGTPPSSGSNSNPNSSTPPIKILRTSSWTYCGPLLDFPLSTDGEADDSSLPPSYHTWHRATIRGEPLINLLKPFLLFAHEFIKSNGLKHYWITIRASLPTNDFNTPRWHVDDDFFDRGSAANLNNSNSNHHVPHTTTSYNYNNSNSNPKITRTQWKLATTLLGPGTMFATNTTSARQTLKAVKQAVKTSSPSHTCTSVICLGCANLAECVRKALADELKHVEVVQSKDGECCFFKVGDGIGAVHSEPRMDGGERVFVNIVPGREEELREVMGKWGMEEWPRAWCLGVPGGFWEEEG